MIFVGTDYITTIPNLAATYLLRIREGSGRLVSRSVAVVVFFGVAVVMRLTQFGRRIWTIGRSDEGERRIIAGLGGMTQMILPRKASPDALVVTELDVLGRCCINGGHGMVAGAVLGRC